MNNPDRVTCYVNIACKHSALAVLALITGDKAEGASRFATARRWLKAARGAK